MSRPSSNEVLAGVKELGSVSAFARHIGVPRSTVNDWYQAAKINAEVSKPDEEGNYPKRSYLITSAQINTDVHEGFMDNLEKMAEVHNATILIPTFTYNKGGMDQDGTGDAKKKTQSQWFHKRVRPYIMNERIKLNDKFEVLGNLNILPTAVNPISGWQTYTADRSAVLPHPKNMGESVATSPDKLAKFLMTSGAVTLPNYMKKNAGLKAEFHHQIGAVLVEIVDNEEFHHRHILAEDDGSFYDLTDRYENGELSEGHAVRSISWGDIHCEDLDPFVEKASWGKGGLFWLLNPDYQFFHDLLDFKFRNHHNREDSMWMSKMANESVEQELKNCLSFLRRSGSKECKSVIVASNHDNAFTRWVREVDCSEEPNLDNKIFLLKQQLRLHEACRDGEPCNLFEEYVAGRPSWLDTLFLKVDESFKVDGVECGMHGDHGINGSKGTPKAYAKIGTKVTSGHTHTSGYFEGVYVNGCSRTLRAAYAKGPSSWSHTHTVQYYNGKRTQVTLINGKYFSRRPRQGQKVE